jgi:radical SAM superfamily enzyme YgiQ (UPF0313 family)
LAEMAPGQRYVRRRSPQNVVEELKWVKRHYPDELDFISFWDDIFTVNRKWLGEFASLYREHIGVPFSCYTYPGLCDDATAELLKTMGVCYVHFGIESGSKKTLEEIYGRKDPKDVQETAQILKNHGIPYRVDLIAANPYETDEDHMETLEVLLQCPHPFRLNPTNPLAFYFNSPITVKAKSDGVLLRKAEGVNGYLAEDDNNYEFWKALFDLTQYPHLSKDFIRSLARDGHLRGKPEVLSTSQSALQNGYWAEPGAFISHEELVTVLRGEIDWLKQRVAHSEQNAFRRLVRLVKSVFPKEAE